MTCPVCQSDTCDKFRPFCSKRCADLDLGRWMTGAYRVATDEVPETAEQDADTPPRPH